MYGPQTCTHLPANLSVSPHDTHSPPYTHDPPRNQPVSSANPSVSQKPVSPPCPSCKKNPVKVLAETRYYHPAPNCTTFKEPCPSLPRRFVSSRPRHCIHFHATCIHLHLTAACRKRLRLALARLYRTSSRSCIALHHGHVSHFIISQQLKSVPPLTTVSHANASSSCTLHHTPSNPARSLH